MAHRLAPIAPASLCEALRSGTGADEIATAQRVVRAFDRDSHAKDLVQTAETSDGPAETVHKIAAH